MAMNVEVHSPDMNATSSPISVTTVSADNIPIDDSDGGPPALSPITPSDDEEFIATLFPHSLPRKDFMKLPRKDFMKLPRKDFMKLPLSRSPISANPHLRTEEDRSLFNHYIHVVSRALSRSRDVDRNPFLVTLLPLATVSDTVTSVILSLSGCHWKRVYPTIWGCALTRQGKGCNLLTPML
jgi:hypothetical protein